MTHDVCVKIAPIVTAERMNNPAWERPGRTLYRSGALRFLPNRSEIPLIVDHNMERQIGVVNMLFEMDWTDGGPWICARATATNVPPWLKPNTTKVSFGRWGIHSIPVGEADRVHSAYVKEVSVLSPDVEPAEPLACVMSLRPTETPKPKPPPTIIHRTAPVARRITPDDELDECLRRVEWYGNDVPAEVIIEHMKTELAKFRGRGW